MAQMQQRAQRLAQLRLRRPQQRKELHAVVHAERRGQFDRLRPEMAVEPRIVTAVTTAPGPERDQRVAVEPAHRGAEPLALQALQLLVELGAFRLCRRMTAAQHQA